MIHLQNMPQHYSHLSTMHVSDKFTLKKKAHAELECVKSKKETARIEHGQALVKKCPGVVEAQRISASASLNDSYKTLRGEKRKLDEPSKQQSFSDNPQVKRKLDKLSKRQKHADNFSYKPHVLSAEKSEAGSTITGAFEDGTLVCSTGQDEKGLKMNLTRRKQCALVLKSLMHHTMGWVFNQPVDPIKLGIPDYFKIISKPMDLGTVKQKLEKKIYSSTNQFAEDVRLTFSNAMAYNPPINDVHILARNLNNVFNSRWKSFELKWRKECSTATQQLPNSSIQKQSLSSKHLVERTVFTSKCTEKKNPSSKSLTSTDKLRLRRNLAEITRGGCIPERLLNFLHKTCLLGPSGDKLNFDIDILNEEILWELDQVVMRCVDSGPLKGSKKTTSYVQEVCQSSDSDGGQGPVVDKGNLDSQSASLAITSIEGKEVPPCQEQLSPTKALRAARLKSRFADTIVKAKTHLYYGEKGDPARIHRESEELKKKQQEERQRIEAQVKAAKAELKMSIEREREAARLAVQKMEKTVTFDDYSNIFKDLQELGYAQPQLYIEGEVSNIVDGIELQSTFVRPLQQLGLVLKEEDINLDEEIDDWMSITGNNDVEEGEITY